MGFLKSQAKPAKPAKPAGPSTYPYPLKHIVLGISMLLTAGAAGLLGYFIYYLRLDKISIPWHFIFLLAICGLTLLSHALAFVIKRNSAGVWMLLHVLVVALWIVGLVLLGKQIDHMVLSRPCNIKMWLDATGVTVCRLYKTFFALLVASAASNLAVVAVDLKAWLGGTQANHPDRSYRDISSGKKRGIGAGIIDRANTWGLHARQFGGGSTAYEPYSSANTGPTSGHAQLAMVQPRSDSGYGDEKRGFRWNEHSPIFSDEDMSDLRRLVPETPDIGYTPHDTPKLT